MNQSPPHVSGTQTIHPTLEGHFVEKINFNVCFCFNYVCFNFSGILWLHTCTDCIV